MLIQFLLLFDFVLLVVGRSFSQFSALNENGDLGSPKSLEYDYIVVGCGPAGLTVSMRLSENNVTVLCIEAGPADSYEEGIQFPVDMGRTLGSQYDWGLSTVAQTQLDGQARPMPQGRGVGGGSLINGMLWNRGHEDDFRAWESLGNEGWGWDSLLGYFRKSENYTPIYTPGIPSQYQANGSEPFWQFHGFEGPVHVSYPKYYWNQTVNFFQALEEVDIPIISDPNAGGEAGGYYLPSSMHPTNQTRSDARRAYMDPFIWRPNFHVLYNSQVTQILFQNFSTNVSQPFTGGNPSGRGNATSTTSNLFGGSYGPTSTRPVTPPTTEPITVTTTKPVSSISTGQMTSGSTKTIIPREASRTRYHATAVEFAGNASLPRQTAHARREVIVAAGALHSPQLLQLSGFGPSSVLKRYNISIAEDLPGVGNNLQDHAFAATSYQYNNKSFVTLNSLTDPAFNASAERQYRANKTGPWTARVSTAIAFLSLPQITNDTEEIISSAYVNGNDFLPDTYESTLRHGYQLQRNILASRLNLSQTPAYEILNDNAGALTITLQRPFSRGYTEIRSNNPFDTPIVDPRWAVNPADFTTLVRAIDFNQQILRTTAYRVLNPSFTNRPHQNALDGELRSFINTELETEFHPSGTCAMLPLDQGGVVDTQLLVYGTDNLRVVDASMMPMIPGAHLMAAVYAVAEKAADIIKTAAKDPVQPLPVVGGDASQTAQVQWMLAYRRQPGGEDTTGNAET